MEIELPLLHSAGDGQREALWQTKTKNLLESRLWSVGAVTFVLGLLFNGVNTTGLQTAVAGRVPHGTIIYGVLQVTGLLTMTIADLDVNMYLRKSNTPLAVFLAISWCASYALLATPITCEDSKCRSYSVKFNIAYLTNWLALLPMLYLFLRWTPVISLRAGFPRFTDLFSYALAMQFSANALSIVILALEGLTSNKSSYAVLGVVQLAYGAFMASVVAGAVETPWKCESRTVHMAMTTYLYLFGVSVFYLANLIISVDRQWPNDPDAPLDNWVFVVVVLLPTAIMLYFRSAIHGALGGVWLRRRMRRDQADGSMRPDWGGIKEVEGSIAEAMHWRRPEGRMEGRIEGRMDTAKDEMGGIEMGGIEMGVAVGNAAGLNAYCYDGECDSYTLLMAAAANGHLDSVRRLLTIGSVQLDMGSQYQGLTALFLATLYGHRECASALLAHGCDVQKRSTDGRDALFIASACNQPEILGLLITHGAQDRGGFMGLTATDAARTMLRGTVLG
jgi:hypothetical protein